MTPLLHQALRNIENLLLTTPHTTREAQIYTIACAALNALDGDEPADCPDMPTAIRTAKLLAIKGMLHKQWYLEQIFVTLGGDLEKLSEEHKIERGIP